MSNRVEEQAPLFKIKWHPHPRPPGGYCPNGRNQQVWRGRADPGAPVRCRGTVNPCGSCKNPVVQFLAKLEVELPWDPVIPLLGTSPGETEAGCQRDICTSVFTAALSPITAAKTWDDPGV